MNVNFDGSERYPCKGCIERGAMCHASCEKYKRAIEITKLIRENRQKDKMAESAVIEGSERRNKKL